MGISRSLVCSYTKSILIHKDEKSIDQCYCDMCKCVYLEKIIKYMCMEPHHQLANLSNIFSIERFAVPFFCGRKRNEIMLTSPIDMNRKNWKRCPQQKQQHAYGIAKRAVGWIYLSFRCTCCEQKKKRTNRTIEIIIAARNRTFQFRIH